MDYKCIPNRARGRGQDLELGTEVIRAASNFKYLGVIITSDGGKEYGDNVVVVALSLIHI